MSFNIKTKKILSEENCKRIIQLGISLRDQLSNMELGLISDYDNTKTYTRGQAVYYDNYLYKCLYTATGDFDETKWQLIGDDLELIEKSDVEAMLNLTDEQLKTLQSLILDSTIELSHVWSSSKTYEEIQNAIKKGETFTLQELAKKTGASYKIVTKITDVTSTEYLYLLANANNAYDIYALIDGTAQKIGDTTIDLSQFYTKTEIDNDFLKKTDADSKFATITTVDGKVDKTSILTTISSTPSDEKLLSEKAINDTLVKKTDITTTINSTSTNDTIPSAKLLYDELSVRNIKTYTTLEALGLASGCSVEDIFLALPDNSYCEIGCSSSASGSLYAVTNVPIETSSTYGLLSIRKLNKTRFSIEYKFSGGGILLPNTLYIGTLKGNDGTGLTWKRVCTTSVVDVGVTNITMNSTYVDNPLCKYQVVNGICYVDFMSGTYKLTSNVNGVAIASGLPIPKTGQTCTTYVPWSCGDATKQVILFVNDKGEIVLHASSNANSCPIFCSFSYPVAK